MSVSNSTIAIFIAVMGVRFAFAAQKTEADMKKLSRSEQEAIAKKAAQQARDDMHEAQVQKYKKRVKRKK